MDRNIITAEDAQRITAEDAQRARVRQLEEATKGPPGAEGGHQQPKPADSDQWFERLAKYIPAEALGLYLAVEGIIRGQDSLSESALRAWLGFALIVAAVFCWLYLERLWNVRRKTQRAVSVGALVLYVFAIGGVFATWDWYEAWYGTLAVVIVTAFLALYVPSPEQPTA